ncbi:protein SENSITIVE TO UV 2 [Coffea arabica]|uniref:Protein SENSITIVE TO UV 2 n=1 Tax=Coffea arabica TaxID=13443 RepID=A0A6P6SCY3_COFAR
MATEGFEVEEWDADFLDQLVQAEELALLTTSATQQQQQSPPPQQRQQQLLYHHPQPPLQPSPHPVPPYGNISYSPPRELSQRVHDTSAVGGRGHRSLASSSISVSIPGGPESATEREIYGLKRELGHVSEQLKVLEEECIDLKKQRDKKEEQLKFISARIEAREAEDCPANSISLCHSVGKDHDDDGVLPECQKNNSSNELFGISVHPRTSPSKAVGVQTEDAGDCDNSCCRNDVVVGCHHHKKLLGVWNLSDDRLGKNLALNLFGSCEADLKVLFGYLYLSLHSNTMTEHPMHKSNVPLKDHHHLSHSTDAAIILHLYLMLTKIGNQMVRLEDLLEALVDCCRLKNGVIVYRSLRVLHVVIKHASHMQKKIGRRENIIVTGPSAEHILAGIGKEQSLKRGSSLYHNAKNVLNQWDSHPGVKWLNSKRNFSIPSLTNFEWVSLFELMSQIAMTNSEEHVKLEAVSIMNMILISSTVYSEREKFAADPVFHCISQLLRKETGLCLRKEAVNLLYQLLNCPKVTAAFCMENGEAAVSAELDAKTYPSFREFNAIMDGLVECVTCTGNSTKELKLRRCAVTVLAFIASLGKAGLGIILNHRLPERTNILASILESLASDVNLGPLDSAQSVEVFRERTLVIREALILLNRLVSHPQFSTAVLQALTSGREVTSLTIDVAKRLSHKGKFLWQDDSITKQIRESEIVELARVFKRRVFTFLGDGVS